MQQTARVKELIKNWENAQRVMRKLTKHERKKHFNMGYWGRMTPCGTVQCIAGFCAFDKYFNKFGMVGSYTDMGQFDFGGVFNPWERLPHIFGDRGFNAVILGDKWTEGEFGEERALSDVTFAEVMRGIKHEIHLLKTVGEG